MKGIMLMGLLATTTSFIFAQNIDKIINPTEVERIEKILSSDDMQGRRTFSPGIDKAALFIADEFKKAGLQPINGKSYLQEFSMITPNVEPDGSPRPGRRSRMISTTRSVVDSPRSNRCSRRLTSCAVEGISSTN